MMYRHSKQQLKCMHSFHVPSLTESDEVRVGDTVLVCAMVDV